MVVLDCGSVSFRCRGVKLDVFEDWNQGQRPQRLYIRLVQTSILVDESSTCLIFKSFRTPPSPTDDGKALPAGDVHDYPGFVLLTMLASDS